jgi:hypothetical protein
MTLRASGGSHRAGEPASIAVELRNVSERSLWVVGVLSGSEEGLRYPHYRPEVRSGGRVVALPGPPEDPLFGPLRPSDFRLLEPGQAFDPTRREGGAAYRALSTFHAPVLRERGRYELRLSMSTESARPEEWLGRFGQDEVRAEVLARVALVPRVTIAAEPLWLDVL